MINVYFFIQARLLESLGKYKLETNFLLEIGQLTLASEVIKDDSIRPLCSAHVASMSTSMLTDFLHTVSS